MSKKERMKTEEYLQKRELQEFINVARGKFDVHVGDRIDAQRQEEYEKMFLRWDMFFRVKVDQSLFLREFKFLSQEVNMVIQKYRMLVNESNRGSQLVNMVQPLYESFTRMPGGSKGKLHHLVRHEFRDAAADHLLNISHLLEHRDVILLLIALVENISVSLVSWMRKVAALGNVRLGPLDYLDTCEKLYQSYLQDIFEALEHVEIEEAIGLDLIAEVNELVAIIFPRHN